MPKKQSGDNSSLPNRHWLYSTPWWGLSSLAFSTALVFVGLDALFDRGAGTIFSGLIGIPAILMLRWQEWQYWYSFFVVRERDPFTLSQGISGTCEYSARDSCSRWLVFRYFLFGLRFKMLNGHLLNRQRKSQPATLGFNTVLAESNLLLRHHQTGSKPNCRRLELEGSSSRIISTS